MDSIPNIFNLDEDGFIGSFDSDKDQKPKRNYSSPLLSDELLDTLFIWW